MGNRRKGNTGVNGRWRHSSPIKRAGTNTRQFVFGAEHEVSPSSLPYEQAEKAMIPYGMERIGVFRRRATNQRDSEKRNNNAGVSIEYITVSRSRSAHLNVSASVQDPAARASPPPATRRDVPAREDARPRTVPHVVGESAERMAGEVCPRAWRLASSPGRPFQHMEYPPQSW
jgi:hypothetical protein